MLWTRCKPCARFMVRWATVGAATVAVALVVFTGAIEAGILRYNVSASMPEGLYAIMPRRLGFGVGSWVAVCVPPAVERFARRRRYLDTGSCRGGGAPLLKVVVAVGPARLRLLHGRLTVDRVSVPGCGSRLARDSEGRPLPFVPPPADLRAGDVYLCGLSPRSYDSRYFGAVPSRGILGRAIPLWAQVGAPGVVNRMDNATARISEAVLNKRIGKHEKSRS